MSVTISPADVRNEILVAAAPEKAFRVFTQGMGKWWPKSHSISTSAQVDVEIEPRVGGRWCELGEDGNRCDWGRVKLWEPPYRLVLDWQLSADWKFDPELHTDVEVTFTPEGAGTRVVIVQSGLEAYGARTAEMVATFASPAGWSGMLVAFKGSVDA